MRPTTCRPRPAPRRVLAVSVTSRGFGFAVMEGPESLVDWGVSQPRPYREKRCLTLVRQSIERYGPNMLVLEDPSGRSRACSARVRSLHTRVHDLAVSMEVTPRTYSWSRVRQAFSLTGCITKYAISRVIARMLPQLAPRLPRYRKPWMSEDYRMAIFDAVALSLTYYQSLSRHRHCLHKHLSHD